MEQVRIRKLSRDFFARDTATVAPDLLGKYLVRIDEDGLERVGRIVEVEAYLGPHDLAAHSSRGVTPRTRVMFGPPGFAYVYLIYGVHHCMNVVTEAEGNGAAVLLRALEPVRNLDGKTAGPGLLCRAMGIDRRLNAHDLLSDDFYIGGDHTSVPRFVRRPRVGVDYAGPWSAKPLRFLIPGNPFVSRK